MAVIEFDGVVKRYHGGPPVLDGLSLSLDQGEFLTCIGPSGCGKTTFLKIINRLLTYEQGSVCVQGRELPQWDPIKLRRSIGYVIQQIGLFPHMTVGENISYVLKITGIDRSARRQRALELLPLVGLPADLIDRHPRSLSGGQQQRVGVARALAADPEILLMDEPFGAVDEITRSNLQKQMQELHGKLQKTVVFVTHDIEEAMRLGTRVLLLNRGRIEQIGTPEEMLLHPAGEFVRTFFGFKNFTSFLHAETLEGFLNPNGTDKGYPRIRRDAALIEGVKMLFDHSADILTVTDEQGVTAGTFSLSGIKEAFLRRN